MILSISKKAFIEKCKQGTIPPIFIEIPFNKPSAVYGTIIQKNSIFLESRKGPERISRYSFIAVDPYVEFKVKDGRVEIVSDSKRGVSTRKPLQKLKEILGSYPHAPDPYLPPFQGGAIGLLSYDFVHYFERLPMTVVDDLGIPDAHFLVVDKVIAFDHKHCKSWIVVCPGARQTILGYNELDNNYSSIYDQAEVNAIELMELIDNANMYDRGPGKSRKPRNVVINYEIDEKYYRDMVKRVKDYIRAGDIFQANLAQRVSSDIQGVDTWQMYLKLSEINPSPFAAFAHFGDYTIVSSSPERLVSLNNGVAQTRPIAGTRPRGKNTQEDEEFRKELILNEKERAEHIMLIDLERNDLGKVCNYGSVVVDELMITEDYSHVMHIVSNVKGDMAKHKDGFDLIKAMFPGGTITGVPKVRCMEIIDELEPVSRGPYTGSIGYIGYGGNVDLNIIIRTFVCKDERSYVHVGAGIVADSDPQREYEETLKKAEALIKTLFEVR
jgi:aminodeoxychorismate synthase component I